MKISGCPKYRVVLLRRLRLPLPLAPRRCRCGGRLDALGDHRSACAQVGVLAHRAGPLERAAARICREAGVRIATHVALRDMNLDAPATDGRRIEIVANGLHVWRGAQAAVDTTPAMGGGSHQTLAAETVDGARFLRRPASARQHAA